MNDEAWVLKLALGRIAENIDILGVTEKKDWLKIQQSVYHLTNDAIAS
ncbi:hypothetical protein [Nostoc sp. T09]|nr:hypothetical protein [Nostoc sp. T09]